MAAQLHYSTASPQDWLLLKRRTRAAGKATGPKVSEDRQLLLHFEEVI